ncbi:AmmeMemoRadiSam system radical SAM enzyme [bacterium]|nr:MAG: AmmeMemoRadiSam system radical SAM enzyme [bacterium]
MLHEAILYDKMDGKRVHCHLCAHRCLINPGKRGKCGVRENRGGTLYSLVYGRLVAENVDPIEKKPLYHFQPGSLSYSIATAGCNLSCSHCQNYEISLLAPRRETIPGRTRRAGGIVDQALKLGCHSISYTYTEPTIFMEFALDCGRLAAEKGLTNVFVTNGFMTPEAVHVIAPVLDAANVDLKAATEDHYRKVCGASLEPVLETIRSLHKAGVWLEVTTLLIPGLNDDEDSVARISEFIASVDPLIPWHISRFFPVYRMTDRPPTGTESLKRAETAGIDAGLKHVYLGNVRTGVDQTKCHHCGHVLLERSGFSMTGNFLGKSGLCPECATPFNGVIKEANRDTEER